MYKPRFAWSDSWLLTAIVSATRGTTTATLTEVIEHADGINKAVISRSELEAGCNRLVAAGYIRITDGRFSASDTTTALAGNPSGSLYRMWDRFADHLGVPRLGEAQKALSGTKCEECKEQAYVPKETYDAAVAAYRRRMRESTGRSRKLEGLEPHGH